MSTSSARPVRGSARPRDLRTAILRAARRLCARHGPAGVTVRGIAGLVGTSATAVYLHFRGLDDVLDHLRLEAHARLAEALGAADAPAAGAPERLRTMGRAYYRFGTTHPRDYELLFGLGRREALRRAVVQREMHTLMLLHAVVRDGIARGELRADLDAMVVTNALWAQVHGVTALAVSGLLFETAPAQSAAVLEAVLEGAVRWLAAGERR